MSETLNLFDLIFIGFGILFIFIAFLRGFVKEIFALLNWILALVLSHLLTPYAAKFFASYSASKLVIDIFSRIGIFIIVFLVTAISTNSLCKALKEKMPKFLDRSLGVLYGIGKTLLIFGFIYSLIVNVYGSLIGKTSEEKTVRLPIWLTEAKCHNILKITGTALDPLVKAVFEAIMKNFDQVAPQQKNLDKKIDEVIENKTDSEQLEEVIDDYGYRKKDIEKMNRLIEIIQ